MVTMKSSKVALAMAALLLAGSALAQTPDAAGGEVTPGTIKENSTAQISVSPDEKTVVDYDHASVDHPVKLNASNGDGCHLVLTLIPLKQDRIGNYLSLAGRVESSNCPINGSTHGIVISDAVRDKTGVFAVDSTLSVFAVR